MAIDDISGNSDDDQVVIVRGNPINASTVPTFIASHLRGSLASWHEIPNTEIRKLSLDKLRTDEFRSFVQIRSKKFVLDLYPVSYSNLRVFRNNGTGGSGGGGKSDSKSIYGEVTGMVKSLAEELHRKNAALAASWFADKGIIKYKDAKTGEILEPNQVSEAYNSGTSEYINYNNADEKAGAQKFRDSAAATAMVTGILAVTSKGKSLFKDPDTLKTVKQGFTRLIKDKNVEMPDIPIKEVSYKKRTTKETKKLHSQSTAVKNQFRKDLANDPHTVKQMKKNGISDADIKTMKERGLTPKGYEVHHKLPLDDGGTNDKSNLILTKKSPFHSAFTAEQKTLTGHLKEGEAVTINFPIPKGSIYPVN